jgi:Zn ribbon nucleic-acid-binding protein
MPKGTRERRELLIAEDICPECGGPLDTGWECLDCGFDAEAEAKAIDIESHNRFP